MLSVCQGHSEMTLVIGTSPLAIDRFSAARAETDPVGSFQRAQVLGNRRTYGVG